MSIYKFVSHDVNMENIKGSKAHQLYELLQNKNFKDFSEDEKELVKVVFNELWNHETYRTGRYKIGGFVIDFSKYLNMYWVKTKHYGIIEVKSFNKTLVRTLATNPSYIEKIVLIKD